MWNPYTSVAPPQLMVKNSMDYFKKWQALPTYFCSRVKKYIRLKKFRITRGLFSAKKHKSNVLPLVASSRRVLHGLATVVDSMR